jgi:hypothetical protein
MGSNPSPCKRPGQAAETFAITGKSGRLSSNNNTGDPDMNAPQELNHEQVLRVKLEVLRREHRDLDDAIAAMSERGIADQLAMVRLKKRKLALKDQIARIADELTPDIIA